MSPVPQDHPKTVPLSKAEGLCMDFPASGLWGPPLRALDHVDLEVDPGEIRGLVGESGSGKTTLARCLLRLLKPASGSVYFDGQDLAALSPAALRAKRREFQMIFQDPYASLNPAMTVEEIVLEPFQIHKIGSPDERNRYVRELLEAVSLSPSLIKRKPAELSGGQQQRVGIARGLALKPRLVVADEPVSALDASVQAQILNLLADLKRHYALTLVLISHSLYTVHYLCSRISVMLRGRIVEEAPAAVFFEKPRHPYSRLLLETMPAPGAGQQSRTDPSAEGVSVPSKTESCCAFFPHCPRALPLCKEQAPPSKEIAPGETVRCFLY